uniref:Uncharacterized protein n=1 Tax=Phytophthora sojae TaxID=67593 RepID=Q6X0M0_PHYSO|nr:unknown [Phytophthora sojae]
MLLNHLMFWMMMTEGAICLVLSLPFGQWVSHAVISFLMKHLGGKDSPANMVATVVLAIVSLLFISDVTTVYKHHSSDEVLSDGMRIRLLTGAARHVHHGLLPVPVPAAAPRVHRAGHEPAAGEEFGRHEEAGRGRRGRLQVAPGRERELQAADGQAAPAAGGRGGRRRQEEEARRAGQARAGERRPGGQGQGSAEQLKKAEGQVAAVTKQAEGQSSAFMKLMDEKSEADKQLETAKAQDEELKRQRELIAKLTEERDSLKTQIQDYDFMFR